MAFWVPSDGDEKYNGRRSLPVEPLAGDSLAENMNLLRQMFYSASTLICTPAARSQGPGIAIGAQAGERRLTQILHEAGFTQVRRAAETATNMVLEARP